MVENSPKLTENTEQYTHQTAKQNYTSEYHIQTEQRERENVERIQKEKYLTY